MYITETKGIAEVLFRQTCCLSIRMSEHSHIVVCSYCDPLVTAPPFPVNLIYVWRQGKKFATWRYVAQIMINEVHENCECAEMQIRYKANELLSLSISRACSGCLARSPCPTATTRWSASTSSRSSSSSTTP